MCRPAARFKMAGIQVHHSNTLVYKLHRGAVADAFDFSIAVISTRVLCMDTLLLAITRAYTKVDQLHYHIMRQIYCSKFMHQICSV